MRTPEADRRSRDNVRAFLAVGSATMSSAVTLTPLVNWIITGGPGWRVAMIQLLVGAALMLIGVILAALDLRRLRREESEVFDSPDPVRPLGRRELWALDLPWWDEKLGAFRHAPEGWTPETDAETNALRVHQEMHKYRTAAEVEIGWRNGGIVVARLCPACGSTSHYNMTDMPCPN